MNNEKKEKLPEIEEKKLPQLELADGSKLDCAMCGLARTTGRLVIELRKLNLLKAVKIFDDPSNTASITMPYDDGNKVYSGFVVLESIDVTDGGVRVSLRRRYVEETTNDQ